MLPPQCISDPLIPIVFSETETPLEPHLNSESPTNEIPCKTCAANKVEEFRVSKTSAEFDGIVGKFSARSVLKYGAYLVGIFVFQTFCAVGYWEMPILREKKGERNLDNSDLGIGENNIGKFLLSGNGIGYTNWREKLNRLEQWLGRRRGMR